MPIPVNHRNHARSSGRFRTALAIGVVMLPAALATASNTHATEPSHATDARPNVVVMLADNLGYGDLGCYGSGGIVRGMPTPNIDGLAADGLMLTQFFVEPGCTPTRAALMTGRHSVRAGLGSIIVAGTPSSLQADEFTMAELFKKNGYATGMVGKWHLGQETQSLPINQGFDTYKVGILETTDGTMYPESMRRTGMDEEAILRTRPTSGSPMARANFERSVPTTSPTATRWKATSPARRSSSSTITRRRRNPSSSTSGGRTSTIPPARLRRVRDVHPPAPTATC